jgi:D-psicose/D-tagatose/L-ribulose 3-epimerase
LWRDIQLALAAGLTLVNFATEPVTMGEVARSAVRLRFHERSGRSTAELRRADEVRGSLWRPRRLLGNARPGAGGAQALRGLGTCSIRSEGGGMRLAVSNIAWPRDQDAAVAGILNSLGIAAIEIAPTKIWPNPLAASDAEISEYRRFWHDRGVAIVAAQALLFGKPELALFESAEIRGQTLAYLCEMTRICARLGAKALVFGSPKNRRKGSLPADAAQAIAVEFFGYLGRRADDEGVCIVMEANPPEYGADFVTHAAEAIDLVERVNCKGFRLHLDTGCMTLSGDAMPRVLERGAGLLQHFHVSEANLDPPCPSGRVDHAAFARELRRIGYPGWVSLEMREPKPFSLDTLAASLRWFGERYS